MSNNTDTCPECQGEGNPETYQALCDDCVAQFEDMGYQIADDNVCTIDR